MAASHPDEWLHQTTDQTVQPKITLHRDQADAVFAGIDQYLMIHGFVAADQNRPVRNVPPSWAEAAG